MDSLTPGHPDPSSRMTHADVYQYVVVVAEEEEVVLEPSN